MMESRYRQPRCKILCISRIQHVRSTAGCCLPCEPQPSQYPNILLVQPTLRLDSYRSSTTSIQPIITGGYALKTVSPFYNAFSFLCSDLYCISLVLKSQDSACEARMLSSDRKSRTETFINSFKNCRVHNSGGQTGAETATFYHVRIPQTDFSRMSMHSRAA